MRGQSAVELVILLSISIVIVLIFTLAIAPIEDRISAERRHILAKEVFMSAAAEMDSATISGDGYMRQFTVPARLRDNTNFTLFVNPEIQRIMIVWGQGNAIGMKMLTSNVSGNFTHGPQLIRNAGGTVIIEEA